MLTLHNNVLSTMLWHDTRFVDVIWWVSDEPRRVTQLEYILHL